MRRRRAFGTAVVAPVAVLLASCTPSRPASAPLPPSPEMLTVEMDEYSFRHVPEVDSGRVVFRLANVGELEHEVTVVRLPEDLPGTLADQLRSPNRRPLPTLRFTTPLLPGEQGAFALDLGPGRYGLLCSVPTEDGHNHALKGMSSELRVRPRRGQAPSPTATVPTTATTSSVTEP